MGGQGFSVPLFVLLMFMPFSLMETWGSALYLPRSPLAMLAVSLVPSPARDKAIADIGVSLLLKAKSVE